MVQQIIGSLIKNDIDNKDSAKQLKLPDMGKCFIPTLKCCTTLYFLFKVIVFGVGVIYNKICL